MAEHDQDDEQEPALVGAESASWAKVIGFTLAGCALAGAGFWAVMPKGVVAQSDAEPVAAEPVRQTEAEDATREEKPVPYRKVRPYFGPPKLSIQISDPLRGVCGATFSESMVVRVLEGEADEIVAEVRIAGEKIVRTRVLTHANDEWTGSIGGLPVDRPAKLLIMASGPYGQESVVKDITHDCPGKIDRTDPAYLGSKAGREDLKEMFDKEFEFDFDSGGSGATDQDSRGSDTEQE
ncbi:MAG: hypothetical protein V9E98_01275 [Candidatus Nanopelagicales bacterium]